MDSARTKKEELEDHIRHAHVLFIQKKVSSEQKIDPFNS
jgi:hypothetical protein